MKFDVLHNFISPLTGRILCDPNKVLIGNAMGIAVPSDFIPISGLPNLTYKYIWRGDVNNRPVEVNDLTVVEENINDITSDIADIFSTIDSIFSTINSILSSISAINSLLNGLVTTTIPALAAAIAALQIQVGGLIAGLATLDSQVQHLRLNNLPLPPDGDVDFAGYRIINLGDAINNTDGVNLQVMNNALDDLRLTNIPAGGDVNMDNFRIINLHQSPEGDFDAVSFKFLWDVLNGNLEVLWP